MGRGRAFSAEFKAKIALEALRGDKTMAELASEYKLLPVQISKWKKQALTGLKDVFSGKADRENETLGDTVERLYKKIGKLEVENDFLKGAVYRN